MNSWFFFSYAHADSNPYLQRFYDELSEEVRVLTTVPKKEINFTDRTHVSFIDRDAISHGEMWDAVLQDGLNTCQVFIPLYSPSYFRSEYCGKEMAVFWERMNRHLKTQQLPASACVILPVLWTHEKNVKESLPTVLGGIQYGHGSYPKEYWEYGAMQLVKLSANEKDEFYTPYTKLIGQLANSIVAAANHVGLQPCTTPLTPLSDVTSIFSPGAQPPAGAGDGGPNHVQFIFVAASLNEIRQLQDQRKNTKFYGDKGGADWRPYLDAYQGNASKIAEDAMESYAKNSSWGEITLDSEVEAKIKAAIKQRKIVVVMVDTWSLQLKKYINLVEPLDSHSSLNCFTMVAWNENDPELRTKKDTLKTALAGAFKTKVIRNPPDFKWTPIKSYETFKEELVKALHQARKDILAGIENEESAQWVVKDTGETTSLVDGTFTDYGSVTM